MEKTILFQSKKIYYRITGSGAPVVLVHGFGEDHHVWDEIVQYLKKDFLIITLDLPGSENSELLNETSMETMAEAINQICMAENFDAFKIIGHSMGGYITLAFAALFENKLSGFGLFHSTAFADSEEKKETRKKGIKFIQQHGAFEFIKTITPNLFSDSNKTEKSAEINSFIEQQRNFKPEALVSYYEAMMKRPDRTNVLKNTKKPVLFIMGKYDTVAPINDMLQQSHLPEISYIHILENAAHMGMFEEKEKCKEILKEFLTETIKPIEKNRRTEL